MALAASSKRVSHCHLMSLGSLTKKVEEGFDGEITLVETFTGGCAVLKIRVEAYLGA